MGLITYWLPLSMEHHWWKAVQAAGLRVNILPGESEDNNSGGEICFRNATVSILFNVPVVDPETGRLRLRAFMLYGSPKGCNGALMTAVERILLSAGGKTYRRPWCQRLYHCSGTLHKQWQEQFKGDRFSVGARESPPGELEDCCPDYVGSVSRQGTTILVYAGQSAWHETGETIFYIALGYDRGLSRLMDYGTHTLEAADRRLLACGAVPVKMQYR